MGEDQGTVKGTAGRTLMVLAALVIVIAGLRAAQPIVTQVLLAAFLAVICYPALAWLQEKGFPNWLALLIVVVVGTLVVLSVVALAGASLTEFYNRMPEYQGELEVQRQQLVQWLEHYRVDVSEIVEQEGLDPQGLLQLAKVVLGTLGSLSGNLVLILLIFVFLLLEASGLPDKIRAMPGHSLASEQRITDVLISIRHYLAIKTQMSLVTGTLVAVWLAMLDVDFPLLWGLLAFLFNFVPNIGSVIAAIPAVVLALVQLGPGAAVMASVGYASINGVIGYIVEPRLMGRGLGLSTLVVFLSLLVWGWVLGPVGMLLSVPLTMLVKIALESSEETRWIAILLAAEAPPVATEDPPPAKAG